MIVLVMRDSAPPRHIPPRPHRSRFTKVSKWPRPKSVTLCGPARSVMAPGCTITAVTSSVRATHATLCYCHYASTCKHLHLQKHARSSQHKATFLRGSVPAGRRADTADRGSQSVPPGSTDVEIRGNFRVVSSAATRGCLLVDAACSGCEQRRWRR